MKKSVNKFNSIVKATLLVAPFLVFSYESTAGWSVPDDNHIVAQWSISEIKALPETDAQKIQEIRQHFSVADRPGESWRYDRIYLLMQDLKSGASTAVSDDELNYYQGRLLQHRHEFEESEQILSQITEFSPFFTSAVLMRSQINIESGNADQARQACLSLVLKQADLAAVCSIATEENVSKESHELMTSVLKRLSRDDSPSGRALTAWVSYQKARSYLNKGQYASVKEVYEAWGDVSDMTVADLVTYSEALLQNNQPSDVLRLLESFGHSAYPDDALIVQLARAEKQADRSTTEWRDFATVRMAQRVQRRDQSYSELIALYLSTIGKESLMKTSAGLIIADPDQDDMSDTQEGVL